MSADQGWDLITIILGGAVAIALVVIFGVPIATAVQNKLHKKKMRRHFSATRARRGSVEDTTQGVRVGASPSRSPQMLDGKRYFAEFPDEDPENQSRLLRSPEVMASLKALEKELSRAERERDDLRYELAAQQAHLRDLRTQAHDSLDLERKQLLTTALRRTSFLAAARQQQPRRR